jgi:hypothetical protein
MSMAAEKNYLLPLLAKLDEAFSLNLDMDPCFARALIEINEQKAADSAEKLYAVLGNSHAANTARSLEKTGKNVLCLTERSWKISADSVAAVMANLSGQSDQPDMVIIQVLDNNTFLWQEMTALCRCHGKVLTKSSTWKAT